MATAGQLISALEAVGLHVITPRCTATEVVILCPLCGDTSGNRGVAISSLLTNCWRCNKGGPLIKWARRAGYVLDLEDAAPSAKSIDEVAELVDGLDSIGDVARPSGYVPSVQLPRGFVQIVDEPDCAYGRLIGKMARRKRLDFEDLAAAGVGFTRDDRKWEPFAIFPVTEWGRPVYYQGRTYVDTPGASTKLFPNKVECPLSSRYWLYNIDEVPEVGGVLVMVESILNVLSLKKELGRRKISGVVPLAVFKHKLSTFQREKLVKAVRRAAGKGNPVTEVCFMYDGRTDDEVAAGRSGDAARSAREDAAAMGGSGIGVSVVDLPDRVDPNDDAACAVDCFLARQPYSGYTCVSSLVL